MNSLSVYPLSLLVDGVQSTSTTIGATVDLANYVNVGKRDLKFIVTHAWGSTVAATAETVTIYLEEMDSSASAASTVTGTGITGSTVTSTAGGEAVVIVSAMISKRFVRARAVSSAASGLWGVSVVALPIRRFAA